MARHTGLLQWPAAVFPPLHLTALLFALTCKEIILSLPHDPPPTVDQMAEACWRLMNIKLTSHKPLQDFSVNAIDMKEVTCFNCGKRGHFSKNCRSATPAIPNPNTRYPQPTTQQTSVPTAPAPVASIPSVPIPATLPPNSMGN